MNERTKWISAAAMVAILTAVAAAAPAGERTRDGWWAAMDGGNAAALTDVAEAKEWQKPLPVSFSIDYTIVSDYIWRGQNFSESTREGREGLNHQLIAGVEWELKRLGVIGYSVFLEWWAFERDFNGSDGHLQEVDHTVYWTYDLSNLCPVLPVSVELGWIAYVFPQTFSSSDGHFTHEVYMILSLDDSKLFRTAGGVLNPTFSWYWDMDDFKGHWWEFGISHDFALSDLGAGGVPVVKDMTVSPSLVMGIDHNFYSPVTFGSGKATRIATLVYGLSVNLDVSSALGLPEQYGSLYVTGFLNFSQAIAGVLRDNLMNDEFYGGMSVGWEW